MQILGVGHHHPYISSRHGECPCACSLSGSHVNLILQGWSTVTTCSGFTPRGVGANGHVLCRIAAIGRYANGNHVVLFSRCHSCTTDGNCHRAVSGALVRQRDVIFNHRSAGDKLDIVQIREVQAYASFRICGQRFTRNSDTCAACDSVIVRGSIYAQVTCRAIAAIVFVT